MTILRRAFRNILRGKFRTLLVSLVLALSIAVLISTLAGVDASESTVRGMTEEYKETAQTTIEETEKMMLLVSIMGGGEMPAPPQESLEEESYGFITSSREIPLMEEVIGDDISSIDGVEAVIPLLRKPFGEGKEEQYQEEGRFGTKFTFDLHYIIWGIPLNSSLDEEYHVQPIDIIEGRELQEGDDSAVLIGEELKDYFGAGVGDTINIEGTDFQVVGIYSSSSLEKKVYMSLPDAQRLLDLQGKVSDFSVYAESLPAVDDVVAKIKSRHPSLSVNAYKDQAQQSTEYIQKQQKGIMERLDTDLSQIQTLGTRITLVSGIIGVLLIFGMMFYTVRERTKEIGILKALGFSNRDVLKQFIFEGMGIGLIGGLIGLAIAGATASVLGSWLLNPAETLETSVPISLNLQLMLIGLGTAILFGALGSLYPAWRASHVSPMEALRHE